MQTRVLLASSLAALILTSVALPSSAWAQATAANSGASAGAAAAGDATAGAGLKAGADADVKAGAQICPDGTPMPANGLCPPTKQGDAKAGAAVTGNGGTAGARASNATKSGAATDTTAPASGAQTKPAGNAGASSNAPGLSTSSSTTNVTITADQRTEIQKEIKVVNVAPVTVNFSVDVGIVVPQTVHLEPLPPTIIKIIPGYSGFLFFLLADGRIVIVEPHSLKIVLII